jgi:hypothetical protein
MEEEADTVEVILGVHDTIGLRVPEILVVDVFELEFDPEFVGELVPDFETMGLTEFVCV